jgi:hypothetical protein
MKNWTLAKVLLAAIALPLFAGCATRHEVIYTQQPAGQTIIVQHPSEPPPVEVETQPPAPDTADVWIPGAWEWHENHWVWEPGRWVSANPGHEWVPGHWERMDQGYTWIDGHWE